MIQIMVGGVWTDYKKAYMQGLTVFADGQFRNGFSIGNQIYYSSATQNTMPLSIQGGYLHMPFQNSNNWCIGSYLTPAIDLTNYSQIEVKYYVSNAGTLQICTMDVSGLTSTVYLYAAAINSTSNFSRLHLGGNLNNTDYINPGTGSLSYEVSSGTSLTYDIESIVIS